MAHAAATLDARRVVSALKEVGTTHVVWLPDSESGFLHQALADDPDIRLVPVSREGEAFGIAAGLLLGGKRPVVIIQSTGFFEAGDSIRGLGLELQLPLLLLIGYRGYRRDTAMSDTAAIYLEPVLHAWGIPYSVLERDEDVQMIVRAQQEARTRPGLVAVLVGLEYR